MRTQRTMTEHVSIEGFEDCRGPRGRFRTAGARLLTAAALLLLAVPAARAQDVPDAPRAPEATDCRCVGPDGEEIEECVCMRMPDMRQMREMARAPLVAFEFPGIREGSFAFRSGPRLGVAIARDDQDAGVVIEEVVEGSPAQAAGLREGDVITHFAGTDLRRPIEGEEDEPRIRRVDEADRPVARLTVLVSRHEPGDRVAVRYLRDGSSREALAELDDRGREGLMVAPWMGADGEEVRIRLREVEEEMRERMPEIRRQMRESQEQMREAMEHMREFRHQMPRIEIRDDSLFFFRGDSLVDRRPFFVDSAAAGVYRYSPGPRGALRPAAPRIRGGATAPRAVVRPAPRVRAVREARVARAAREAGVVRPARAARTARAFRATRLAPTADPAWLRPIAGVRVVPLAEGMESYFGTGDGVLVVDVAEGSRLGVEPGDVILSVDGRAVQSPRELRRALLAHDGEEPVALRVVRRDREVEVEGRVR